MPAICIFYGIIIRMYNEKGGKHHKPHIHAEYQGKEIVIALDGEILEDSDKFPKNKLKLIDAWMEIHFRGSKVFQNPTAAITQKAHTNVWAYCAYKELIICYSRRL